MRAIILILAGALMMGTATAQSWKVDKTGAITKAVKKDTTKKPDPVYKIIDGTIFYKGTKGGIYYWRTSKQTGKLYKAYLKQN